MRREASRLPIRGRTKIAGSLCLALIVVLVIVAPMPARAATFSNPTPITIPSQGLFSPYPSPIQVSGLTGTITDVDVTLYDFSHGSPEDVDIVLVGPVGTGYAVLMADAGDASANTVADLRLSFDASASSSPPCFGHLGSGTYRPIICQSYGIDPALTNTDLSTFNGKNPNGTWELYGGDDANPYQAGMFAGGWSLEITTNGPSVSAFTPLSGGPGTTVAIEGGNLTGVSSVRFGGTAATTLTVSSSTLITAEVPQGAATGPITVTTQSGTVTSATSFTVTAGPPATDHAREVSLSLRRATARGTVAVEDGFAGCVDNVGVKVQRRENGRWRLVGSAATTADGRFTVSVREPGTYRAIARRLTLAPGDVCLKDISPLVRLRAT